MLSHYIWNGSIIIPWSILKVHYPDFTSFTLAEPKATPSSGGTPHEPPMWNLCITHILLCWLACGTHRCRGSRRPERRGSENHRSGASWCAKMVPKIVGAFRWAGDNYRVRRAHGEAFPLFGVLRGSSEKGWKCWVKQVGKFEAIMVSQCVKWSLEVSCLGVCFLTMAISCFEHTILQLQANKLQRHALQAPHG